MTYGITIKVEGLDRVVQHFDALPERFRAQLRPAIIELTRELTSRVRQKLSGGVLNIRSGKLLASIQSELIEEPTRIFGQVSSVGVIYAAIHEYGGIIKHPGSSKFQSWVGSDGKRVFTHFTKPHDIPIPERSYMRSSLAEMEAQIVARLTAASMPAARF